MKKWPCLAGSKDSFRFPSRFAFLNRDRYSVCSSKIRFILWNSTLP